MLSLSLLQRFPGILSCHAGGSYSSSIVYLYPVLLPRHFHRRHNDFYEIMTVIGVIFITDIIVVALQLYR